MPKQVSPANTFNWFRKIAMAEGMSFLVLLFIAMPLKYFAGFPVMVTIFGSVHGILFVAYFILLREAKVEYNKDWNWALKAAIASLLPFGTLYMDRQWKREELEIRNRQTSF
jgi:integral membrane protein